MKEENTQEELKKRIRKVVNTRHRTYRRSKGNNSIAQAFIIIIAFILIGYVGFNLLLFLLDIIF